MEQKLPEEDIIRKYLLGTLREPELSQIEQKLLSNQELSQTADVIEDEIIEQYLDGSLDDLDKKAVETHFLSPPAHRQQLHYARLLRHHFALQTPAEAEVPKRLRPDPVRRLPSLWTYGGAAAAVVLAISTVHLSLVETDLKKTVAESQKSQAVLQADLARARDQVATLEERLQTQPTSSVPILQLRPGVVRSSGGVIPKAMTRAGTDLIKVDVLLPEGASGLFQASLHDVTGGKDREVWWQEDLQPVPAPPLSRLRFYLPAQALKSGSYNLVVSPESNGAPAEVYPFDSKRIE
jgi:hypothetical protein